MKIDDFLDKYNSIKYSSEQVEKLYKSIIKDVYIPLEQKQSLASHILNNSYYITEDDGSKKFKQNSVARKMLECISLIDLYTTLERTTEDNGILRDYNKLNEIRFFDNLCNYINK